MCNGEAMPWFSYQLPVVSSQFLVIGNSCQLKEALIMGIAQDIIKGLEQALEYERGNRKVAHSTKIYIAPMPKYSAEDIKSIRNDLKMTQWVFADLIGVSQKTVEAWESGTRKPAGSAIRMIQLITNNKGIEKQIVDIYK